MLVGGAGGTLGVTGGGGGAPPTGGGVGAGIVGETGVLGLTGGVGVTALEGSVVVEEVAAGVLSLAACPHAVNARASVAAAVRLANRVQVVGAFETSTDETEVAVRSM